nr:type II toxin-antitoxin system RelE/ParE family toxin [uncultured Carboxylicivirga sp.]
MKITWSAQAKLDYYKVLDYLNENWSINEVKSFIDKTEEVLNVIKKHPQSFTETSRIKNVRKGLVTKHNYLFYKVMLKKKEIILLTFWDTRQDHQKLKY